MRALIVEDERMARSQLIRLLAAGFPDMEVAACTDSVRGTVEYLAGHPPIDLIFMDVELSDGDCFEIFRQVEVDVPVIMTTAYDSYAVKAFETGSIDYLLKPIDSRALERAVGRARSRGAVDVAAVLSTAGVQARRSYREHITVRVGDRLIPVEAGDIAWFTSEDKFNYMTLLSGEKYLIDATMDALEDELDPELFCRISRGGIVSRSAIVEVQKHINGRLRLRCLPMACGAPDLIVARARVQGFLSWLG